jgi:murein DD-endopeptidase MepM/ murein hydrolase activator NlpD
MLIERHIAFSRVAVRLMMAAGAAALMAGCSDASRFSDPFSDPFSSGSAPKIARGVDRAPTGSIAATATPEPSNLPGRVESRPLPGATAPAPVAQAAPRTPAPVASAPAAATGGAGASHWTADGGTPVTVAAGETAAMLATRYGVPTDALLRANGYSNAAQVQPGARLIIPVYRAGAVASAAPAPVAPARAAEAKAVAAAKPVVKPDPKVEAAAKAKAEREAKLAREEELKAKKAEALAKEQETKRAKKAEADKAAADKAAEAKKLAEARQAEAKKAAEAKAAEAKLAAEKAKLAKVEAAKSKADAVAKAEAAKAAKEAKLAEAEAAKAAKAERQAKAEEAAAAAQAEKQAKVAATEKQAKVAAADKSAKVAAAEKPAEAAPAARSIDKTTTTASVPPAAEEATKVSTSDPDRPEFRWPARGRIIQGFSTGGNDGINIAVPEGTPVKAAEGGQVAYAGSELKGYGNLVLIRHPNGYVTAYAHNGELEVKRGDTVKRGQTIAKSGQSGNVGSPQLHFELRKGATPVDPTSYLAGL